MWSPLPRKFPIMQIVPARSIEKMGRPLGTAPSFECGGFPHVEDLLICSFQLRVAKLVCVVRSQCLDATGTLYSLRRIDRGLPQCRPIARHPKLAGALSAVTIHPKQAKKPLWTGPLFKSGRALCKAPRAAGKTACGMLVPYTSHLLAAI